MAARKDLLEALRRVLEGNLPKSLYAGELPEKAFQELAAINPAYMNPRTTISNHGLISRMEKDGWSLERTAQAYAELLNSVETSGIPNFSGGTRAASEALWLPKNAAGLFAPSVPLVNGETKLLTVYDPAIEKVLSHLKNVDWPSGVRHPSMSGVHRAIPAGEPSPQPQRLSAVEDHSDIKVTDPRLKVKALLPYILGTGAAAGGILGAPGDSEAANHGVRGLRNLFGSDPTSQTGGKMRFEIPDNSMQLAPELAQTWTQSDASTPAPWRMGGVVQRPETLRASSEEPPASTGWLRDVDNQGSGTGERFGIGLRDVLQGMTSLPDMAALPVANLINSAMGGDPKYFSGSGKALADVLGLPEPKTDGLGNMMAQSVAGGLPAVPLGIAVQASGRLPALAAILSQYKLPDLGLDMGMGGLGYAMGGGH